MGLLDKMLKTATTKAIIHASGEAAAKVIGATIEAQGQVSKQTIQKIAAPQSAEHYCGMRFEGVQAELSAYGFTNIVLLPKRDLINGWLTKDGSVESVTIGGKANFRKKAKFPAAERVVIAYHTFKSR